jgi:hypothetical protein
MSHEECKCEACGSVRADALEEGIRIGEQQGREKERERIIKAIRADCKKYHYAICDISCEEAIDTINESLLAEQERDEKIPTKAERDWECIDVNCPVKKQAIANFAKKIEDAMKMHCYCTILHCEFGANCYISFLSQWKRIKKEVGI